MTWEAALELVIERSRGAGRFGHERYRSLCADGHPDHPIWRARMVEMATGRPPRPPRAPGPWRLAGNALAALWRVARALAARRPVRAPRRVVERRRAICGACPAWDAARGRCNRCGCRAVKLELATESCPDGRW